MTDRQYHLLDAGVVVRDAVSAAIGAGDFQKAVEWLDRGHSVIWNQLFDLQTDDDNLKMQYPELAANLMMLSKQLEGSSMKDDIQINSNNMLSTTRGMISKDYHDVAHQQEDLLKTIRKLPKFDQFLLPRTFTQLQTAANDRTVILVNVSEKRCDALVLMSSLDDVLHVPLDDFDLRTAEELQLSLSSLLPHNVSDAYTDVKAVPARHRFEVAEPDIKQILSKWNVTRDDDRHLYIPEKKCHVDSESRFRWILEVLWVRVAKPILDSLAFTVSYRTCVSNWLVLTKGIVRPLKV
jgi:hypothetical protein